MANVSDTRTTRSIGENSDLAPTASDPERILRSANISFRTTFANPDMSRDADDQVETLEQTLESDNEGPSSPLAREPVHYTDRSVSDILASTDLRAIMRLMAQEEAECIYASRVNPSMTRAAEGALSDVFQVGFDSANAGLKISSHHLVESVLTEMAQKDALDEVFDRSIDRWTQSSPFMDALARRALTSPRFVRPVAKFIRKNMRDQDEEKKTKPEFANLSYPILESPLASSYSSRSSTEDDKRNKASHRRHETIANPTEDKNRKQRRKYKSSKASSSSLMSLRTLSSSSERDSPPSSSEPKALKARSAEPKLPVLQTVKKHYALAVDYRTYRLANRSPRYDDTVSSYVAKLMKKAMSQMKTHFFDPKDPYQSSVFSPHLNSRVIRIISTRGPQCGFGPTLSKTQSQTR